MEASRLIGVIVCSIGILIFCFGKKFFLLRYLFKDRSMFSQMFVGFILFVIGCAILFFTGAFSEAGTFLHNINI